MNALSERLDEIAATYDIQGDFDRHSNAYGRGLIMQSARGLHLLEVGCGWGDMTLHFAPHFRRIVALDGSQEFVRHTQRRCSHYSHIDVQHSLIEEFATEDRFEDIVIAHVLEHIADPVSALAKLRSFLGPDGQIHIIVPNARSLHRRIGKAMGLLREINDFSARDIQLGHMRVYDSQLLCLHAREAGLNVTDLQGILIKPLSNAQMQAWDPAVIDALFKVGQDEPELCNELYVRAGVAS